jgi:hypothetical protein
MRVKQTHEIHAFIIHLVPHLPHGLSASILFIGDRFFQCCAAPTFSSLR